MTFVNYAILEKYNDKKQTTAGKKHLFKSLKSAKLKMDKYFGIEEFLSDRNWFYGGIMSFLSITSFVQLFVWLS